MMNQLCSSFSSLRPSSLMRACARGLAFHCGLIASSPPMWMYSPGKSAITSVSTSCMKAMVVSDGLRM